MAWLRIDDGFTRNSKIAQLTDAEFRVWMRLLCHCAGSRDPSVDDVAMREVAGLNRQRVQRFHHLDLVDEIGGSYEIHDWLLYQPKDGTNADRQARWRSRRNASQAVTPPVTGVTHEAVTAPVTPSRARDAGAGTRGYPSSPVQSEEPLLPSTPTPDRDGRTDDTQEEPDPIAHLHVLKDMPA